MDFGDGGSRFQSSHDNCDVFNTKFDRKHPTELLVLLVSTLTRFPLTRRLRFIVNINQKRILLNKTSEQPENGF